MHFFIINYHRKLPSQVACSKVHFACTGCITPISLLPISRSVRERYTVKRHHLSLVFPFLCLGVPWPAEAPQVQAAGRVVGDVVEVQHRRWVEDVHFLFLLLLPARLGPAFSFFPFTWLSKTSIYMGQN